MVAAREVRDGEGVWMMTVGAPTAETAETADLVLAVHCVTSKAKAEEKEVEAAVGKEESL